MSAPTSSDLELLCGTPLFSGLERQVVSDALRGRCCVRRVAKGSILPEPHASEALPEDGGGAWLLHTLLILLEGSAVVRARTPAGAGAVLNQFAPGSIFGAATVFSDAEDAVSEVMAEQNCRLLVIGREQFWALLTENPEVLRRYLQFLSGRISFLNRKIASFTTADNALRLAVALYERRIETPEGLAAPIRNATRLAEQLNMTRVSLYRAMEQLTERGLIRKQKNLFLLPDPAALESYIALQGKD